MQKRRIRNSYYSVYNIETDELVIQNTVENICKRLDITKSTVSKAVKNDSIVRRKYKIYYDEEDEDDTD